MIEHFFSRDTITASPWKNGGGVTREVAKSPSQAPFWRLSIATVDQEGPFSSYVNLDRILTVIEGKGMILEHENGDLVADLHIPVHFSGSDAINGLLPNGQIQDFNLIFDGSKFAADVSVTDTVERDTKPSSILVITLIYCLTGAFKLRGSKTLLPHDGVLNPRGKITAVDRSSTALVIEISSKS